MPAASTSVRLVMTAVLCTTLAACACKSRNGTGPGGGSGSGSGPGSGEPTACDGVRDHAAALYRDEATRTAKPEAEAGVIDQEVADNVAMILGDCRQDPPRLAACIGKAQSVAQLERDCAIALDDEGSEGDVFR